MSVYGHFRPARDQGAAKALAARLDGVSGKKHRLANQRVM
jgi:hypothetical protein